MMGIRQLRTLVAIADFGSFSAAAQQLFMTQSAVSMQMKGLEDQLQAALFDRSTRPPLINSRGWQVVEHARKLLEQYENIRILATTVTEGVDGSMHLGVVPSVATNLLPQTLAHLSQIHPALRVRVQSGLSPELALKVDQKKIDIAVITEIERLDASMTFHPLRDEELRVIVHKDMVRPSAAETLTLYPFVRFTASMGVGRVIDMELRDRRIAVNDVMEFDSIEAITSIVRLKLGVAIVPVTCVHEDLKSELIEISLDPPAFRRIGFLVRRGQLESPAVNAVVQAFHATI
jgi:DNA-binding transcriptional LysR family regulator